jgi:hypothetical protein
MSVSSRSSWLLSLAILFAATPLVAQEADSLRGAVECTPRSGLPNVQAKLKAGQPVHVAYLGGSITAAPGWRVKSLAWLREQHPDAEIQEINAAIGGTGSDLGVFRLQNDVLRHEPNLLFVEFAVNDGGASPEQIHKAMEGIVRQTWRGNPNIDICFVYTLSEPVLPEIRAGKMQRSATAMEDVADHYGIPSIHFGVSVVAMEKSGDLVFTAPKPDNLADVKPMVFSTDGVHPHVETGHVLYTEAIARSWPTIVKHSGEPGPHDLPEPLRGDNWERAKQVAIAPAMLDGPWQHLAADHPLARRFAKNMPEMYQATEPGAALEFTIDGTTAAVFDLLGPDGGQLSIQVDDRKPATTRRIDAHCTYHRMGKTTLAHELPMGRHTVRVTLTPEQLDKRSILFERNRHDLEAHPEKYAGHTWYVGSLLIIGDIVPSDDSN